MTDKPPGKLDILLDILHLLEANLETNMRIYDTQLAMLSLLGNQAGVAALVEQHEQGRYYFPPFAVATGMDDVDDPPT